MTTYNNITDVKGVLVGHASDLKGLTGCTVVLLEKPCVAGCELAGAATGSRQLDSLSPFHSVPNIDAIYLTGGSGFGLDSTGGVMRYLSERERGFKTLYARVPIVPSAVIFDLGIGSSKAYPTSRMAYEACLGSKSGQIELGCVGVGVGATIGKIFSVSNATKGGLGSASILSNDGLIVSALAVVNAFGDIIDCRGNIVAGARESPDSMRFINTNRLLASGYKIGNFGEKNTTIAVIATNATLDKAGCTMVARMAKAALARCISPSFSVFDGDIIFVVSTAEMESILLPRIGAIAVEVLSRAIYDAVSRAIPMGNLPSAGDIADKKGRKP